MDHASEIIALDTKKFKIAKKNSDLEIEGERLEQELMQTKGAIEECEGGMALGSVSGSGKRGNRAGSISGSGSGLGVDGQDEVL